MKERHSMAEFERSSRDFGTSLRSYDAKALSVSTGVETVKPSMVQQHFADEVDINTIMRRFGVTGAMPFGSAQGVYGDFSGISDYESAVEKVRDARERFMTLPAEVRERFDNDPGVMVSAANDMSQEEFEALYAPVEPVAPVVE